MQIALRLPLFTAAILLTVLIPCASCLAQDAGQRVFPTPGAAVRALLAAAKASDPKAEVTAVLGPDATKVLSSGDAVADENARKGFVSHYNQMHRLAYDANGRVILFLGDDDWPFPIPLVKKDKGWVFDTAAGEQELLYRRIGANELYTIDVLENLVNAQMEYATEARDRSGVRHYAQKILSDNGRHNGLYWPATAGQPESPIGPLIAKAVAEGYRKGAAGQPIPFHGYIYRVLTGQGKDAPGGARSYLAHGKMTRGFAFVAYPVEYRSSGVMTFMVNQDGVVLQKDLGPQTAQIAQEMVEYNPDRTWERAQTEKQPQEEPPAATDSDTTAQVQGTGSVSTP